MKIFVGDITKVKGVEAIVNAANGIGVMGSGVAGAIARSGGNLLREDNSRIVEKRGPFDEGDVYVSDSGLMKRIGDVKFIYHAVTMKFPGQRSNLVTVSRLLSKVLEMAIENEVKSIAFGGFGCGIGGLDKEETAKTMAHIAQSYSDRIDITVVDTSEEYINAFIKNVSVSVETKNDEEINSRSTNSSPE